MSINGNGDTLTITGARLKVSGGVQVSGSIAYTDDATGFGGVSAQIDGDDTTLNITAGKTSGVAKIERGTSANITDINHANVSNNTTIHIALKNTSSNKGDFVTIGTFEDDDNVKVNYTDEYVIGPGETGMLTLRKVAGVLSLFIREMFSSTATNFDNTDAPAPFYIKDGTNYKYPLYKTTGGNLEGVTINGVQYYRPSSGLKTKTRPPLGIPELIVTPTGNLAIGNSADLTTVNYDVWGVPTSFGYGSIYQGTTKKTSFILENGEASGSFTESGASSGDAYALYVERTDLSTSDTLNIDTSGFIGTIAFHYGAFSASDYSGAYSTVEEAATAGFVYSDTSTTTYTWGTLNAVDTNTSGQTGYSWTPPNDIEGANVLMVAGGGGGGGLDGGGGGAGGLLYYTNQSLSGQKTIVVGNGGLGGLGHNNGTNEKGSNGYDTSFTGLTTVLGGGYGASQMASVDGGSGGSGGGGTDSRVGGNAIGGKGEAGPPRQGYDGGNANSTDDNNGAGGGGAGGPGGDSSSSVGGDGGIGVDYTDVFGTMYGDGGWFASGGGGGKRNNTGDPGTASAGGGTNGTLGEAATDAQKHTGGGGGGVGYTGNSNDRLGGDGGSGIVLIKSSGIGKKIPKVTGASFDSTNVTFTVQQDSSTSIANIKYTINGGSEQTTPVGTLAVAHGVSELGSITVVAYAVDANGDQISTKKTVTGTIPTAIFTPVQLDNVDVSDTRNYKHVSTSGTVYTFQLYNGDVADSLGVETYITYDTSDRKWRDAGTDHPATFVVNSSSSYPGDGVNPPTGHSDPSVATGTNNTEYIHLVRNNGYQHLFTFKMAGWSYI